MGIGVMFFLTKSIIPLLLIPCLYPKRLKNLFGFFHVVASLSSMCVAVVPVCCAYFVEMISQIHVKTLILVTQINWEYVFTDYNNIQIFFLMILLKLIRVWNCKSIFYSLLLALFGNESRKYQGWIIILISLLILVWRGIRCHNLVLTII